ncbi:MAG: hypothetical protein AAFR23_09760, partial [Pseudomonadota bacterium]
ILMVVSDGNFARVDRLLRSHEQSIVQATVNNLETAGENGLAASRIRELRGRVRFLSGDFGMAARHTKYAERHLARGDFHTRITLLKDRATAELGEALIGDDKKAFGSAFDTLRTAAEIARSSTSTTAATDASAVSLEMDAADILIARGARADAQADFQLASSVAQSAAVSGDNNDQARARLAIAHIQRERALRAPVETRAAEAARAADAYTDAKIPPAIGEFGVALALADAAIASGTSSAISIAFETLEAAAVRLEDPVFASEIASVWPRAHVDIAVMLARTNVYAAIAKRRQDDITNAGERIGDMLNRFDDDLSPILLALSQRDYARVLQAQADDRNDDALAATAHALMQVSDAVLKRAAQDDAEGR